MYFDDVLDRLLRKSAEVRERRLERRYASDGRQVFYLYAKERAMEDAYHAVEELTSKGDEQAVAHDQLDALRDRAGDR